MEEALLAHVGVDLLEEDDRSVNGEGQYYDNEDARREDSRPGAEGLLAPESQLHGLPVDVQRARELLKTGGVVLHALARLEGPLRPRLFRENLLFLHFNFLSSSDFK